MSEPDDDDFEIVIRRIDPDIWCDPITGTPAAPIMMTREEFLEKYPRPQNV